MKFIVVCLALSFLALGPACRKETGPSGESARRFSLRGIVREVDATRSQVTVEHEAIAGYMQGMTMPFPVRDDPRVVGLLRPGDRIDATLVVEKDRYWLEKILTRGFVGTPAAPAVTAVAPAKDPGHSSFVTPVANRGVQVGDAVPDFALKDQTGATVRLSQMRGEPVAVTFLYTRCPIATACPMTTAKFSRLDAMLAQKKFGHLLVVTVDPEHDTPEVLAEYGKKAGADPKRWKFLTGSPQDVARVASSFGVMYYPEHGQMIHSQAVAVLDPQGRLSTIYYGETWQPEHILRDLARTLHEQPQPSRGSFPPNTSSSLLGDAAASPSSGFLVSAKNLSREHHPFSLRRCHPVKQGSLCTAVVFRQRAHEESGQEKRAKGIKERKT